MNEIRFLQLVQCKIYQFFSLPDSPSEVTLSPTTINYTKQKGESLGPISCTANCNPSCQYKWIYPDGSLHFTETLSITNLSATEHHGDFRCQITNSQGTTTKYINVVVNCKY